MNVPSANKTPFEFDAPGKAIAAMLERVEPLGAENVPLHAVSGRVLCQALQADRPSPACDVSAMDGYAVRLMDLNRPTLPIAGEVMTGHPPPGRSPAMRVFELGWDAPATAAALRIFTGGPVPEGCDAVIPREQVVELPDAINLPEGLQVKPGQHIRRCGENAQAGETIVEAGAAISPAVAAALATFGIDKPRVYRQLRLDAIVTGNEVHDVSACVQPWQLRDSNGPTLTAMFASRPWVNWRGASHVTDDRDRLRLAITAALADNDALLLTGGVSMGDYDFVPAILVELGCRIVFHKLPIRPGKPALGAIGPDGQAVLGLPGNPVSVMTTARRLALPVLRHRAGFALADTPTPTVSLINCDEKQLALHWSRPVRLIGDGRAELVRSRGSGDIISAARSDGFVEIAANQVGPGPWPFYRWSTADE
ncbi:MAG: molybdopterin molybdotransferase MoeA [Phycisphaeraceae bacterium]|nr:molybdopterin molybdotransferase MoeA [Phycisphaeraceae bacterium]